MSLRGRSSTGREPHQLPSTQNDATRRGEWYADPFGTASERWWDGKKWTRQVRGAGLIEPPKARIALSPLSSPARERIGDAASDFTDAAVGQKLWVRAADPRFFATDRQKVAGEIRWMGSGFLPWPHRFEVLADTGRVGTLDFSAAAELVRIACAEGTWSLAKRRRFGWDLLISDRGHQHVGSYSERRVLGGRLSFLDGTQVDLRHSMAGHWWLQADDGQRLAYIRRCYERPISHTIEPLSIVTPHACLTFLTGCAIVVLHEMMPVWQLAAPKRP